MSHLICRVDNAFQISGRGCVVTPGIPKDASFQVKVGDSLVLRRPNGSVLHTVLVGVEFVRPPNDRGSPILLGAEVTKDQVPVGTEVWTA
jgi:hypothetical protein